MRSKRNKPIQESFTRYDLQGNTLETIERDNDGLITLHESYEYDAAGNKTVETQFDTDGSIKKKHVYSYFNGLRSKRMTYDRKGNLIGEKKYIYEFQDK